MRNLMLTLLTFEPFEKFSKAEQEFVDYILSEGNNSNAPEYPVYAELFDGFYVYCKNIKVADQKKGKYKDKYRKEAWENIDWLIDWKKTYYPAQNYNSKARKLYPILFKKICFFIITQKAKSVPDAENLSARWFLEKLGIGENILRKWGISTRYRIIAERSSYSSLRIYRNGKKREYLTEVIKSVYYEAGRGNYVGKKKSIPRFIDLFGGTGAVAASVEANDIYINDADMGAACFLATFSQNPMEVQRRLADLHEKFVKEEYSHELVVIPDKERYTEEKLNMHLERLQQNNSEMYEDIKKYVDIEQWRDEKEEVKEQGIKNVRQYRELTIRMRNNYYYIYKLFQTLLSNVREDFTQLEPSEVGSSEDKYEEYIYDAGVAWFFLNAIKPNNAGRQFNIASINPQVYSDYVINTLGIDYKAQDKYKRFEKKKWNCQYNFLTQLRIQPSKIRICDERKGKNFIRNIRHAEIACRDFKEVLVQAKDKDFVYLDSPYFGTTGYSVEFKDVDHYQMLSHLRNSSYRWLFSMQCYDINRVLGERRGKAGQELIKSDVDYYKGFVEEFEEEIKYKRIFYTVNKDLRDNDSYVLLSHPEMVGNKEKSPHEILICNFDIRRAIPYISDNSIRKVRVLPFNLFVERIEEGKKSGISNLDFYWSLYEYAKEWRAEQIQQHYREGEIV